MKVLFIGGTGCISGEISALAAQRGDIELHLLNRGNRPKFIPPGARSIQGDVSKPEEIKERIKGMNFDVVADFISYGLPDLERTLDVFKGHFGQFIFVSTAMVYRTKSKGEIITEERTTAGNTLWSYARNKILCEMRLREERESNGLDYTVVRPGFTYNKLRLLHPVGPDHQRHSWTIADRILKGKPLLMHDDGNALCTVTASADFAKAFVGLLGNPKAFGEAFHIASDEYLTWNRVAEMLGEALGAKTKLRHVPAHVLGLELGGDFGEKLIHFSNDIILDSGKVRRLVPEFTHTTSFAQGIRDCVQFYNENPGFKVVNEEWDRTMDILATKYGDAGHA